MVESPSPELPWWLWVLGALIFILGTSISQWTGVENASPASVLSPA